MPSYTLAECQKHTNEKDCWLVIHGKVYDVTEFLDEHPGGYDIVVSNSGKDATDDFDEIGHSKTANEMLQQYLIGDFAGGDPSSTKAASKAAVPAGGSSSSAGSLVKALLPILLVAAAVLYALYGQQKA